MRILSFVVAGLLACAVSAGVVMAQVGFLAPIATVTTFSGAAAAAQIVASNPSRKSIQICNSGTNILWIWPGNTSPAVSAYELPALSTGTTTCFTPPTGAAGTAGSAGAQWNAQPTAAPGQVTVFEW